MAYVTGATARINGTSISVSPTNPTAGNTLAAIATIFGNNPSNSTEAAADNANNPSANTWTRQLQRTTNDADISAYYVQNCKNRSSGTFTVTVTGSSGDRGMAYEEHSGLVTTGGPNANNSASGTGATHSTGSITTTVTCTVIIGGSHATTDTATTLAATNYTFPAASVMEDSTNMPSAMGYRTGVAAATFSVSPTWENGQYAWWIMAFEESGGAATGKGPPPPRPDQRVIYRTRRF